MEEVVLDVSNTCSDYDEINEFGLYILSLV